MNTLFSRKKTKIIRYNVQNGFSQAGKKPAHALYTNYSGYGPPVSLEKSSATAAHNKGFNKVNYPYAS